MPERRYFLDRDEDCHWYVVPVDRDAEWRQYLTDIYDYWDNPSDFVREPEQPEGVERVDGPHVVTFTDWQMEPF